MAVILSGGGAWSSQATFLLAAIGAAVGLGNIWKFPYVAGVSGGGAFLLIYCLAVAAVAGPILVAEMLIGRRGRRSPPLAMAAVAEESGASRHWGAVAGLGVLASFLIMSFYSVIAGWAIAFVFEAGSGALGGIDAIRSQALFESLLADPLTLIFWQGLFVLATVMILAQGLQKGIERAVKFMMPALLLLLLVVLGYAMVEGDFAAAVQFLFEPDFSKVTGRVVLAAVGQAFFSLGVAASLMMVYAAYLPKEVSLGRSVLVIAIADSVIAVTSGLALFPLVFASGLDPAEGPGLIFVTLPVAFGSMPAGALLGTVFFVLLVFAALTSSIGGLEPSVAWIQDRTPMSRGQSASAVGAACFLLGLGSALSFNHWSGWYPLEYLPTFEGLNFFGILDHLTANIMLPVGGFLIAIFAGWRMRTAALSDELGSARGLVFGLWFVCLRFVVPVAIGGIFLSNLL